MPNDKSVDGYDKESHISVIPKQEKNKTFYFNLLKKIQNDKG